MTKKPYLYLIFGIIILIVPTLIYFCFLVPQMSEEYNILLASGGIIGSAGLYGAKKIPEGIKFASMYKLAANSFSIMAMVTIVNKFILQIVGLFTTFIISFILYKILKECYKNAKRRKENQQLATEITRNITENIK